jgi:hypothetical protein
MTVFLRVAFVLFLSFSFSCSTFPPCIVHRRKDSSFSTTVRDRVEQVRARGRITNDVPNDVVAYGQRINNR